MEIIVQSLHFNADQKLLSFLERKYSKLDQFHNRIISAEVILRLNKAVDSANKIVELKINIPGHTLFVKHQCASFEEAADLSFISLSKQLKKHNEKLKTSDHSIALDPTEITGDEI